MFLSPAKVLVIAVVALAVLGPDTLPKVAKQIGVLSRLLRSVRQGLESEVRGTFPDLPPTETITRAVRSPLGFLDQLAEAPDEESGPLSEGSTRPDPSPLPGVEEAAASGTGSAGGTGSAAGRPPGSTGPVEASPVRADRARTGTDGRRPGEPGRN